MITINKDNLYYLNIDKEYNIVNNLSLDNIKNTKWLEVLKKIINYILYLIYPSISSIYLRGGLLFGKTIDFHSDIDLILIINEDNYSFYYFWDEYKKKFLKKNSFVRDIDLFIIDRTTLFNDNQLMFTIKVLSKCLYGEDLSFYIKNYKLYEASFIIKDFYNNKELFKSLENTKIFFKFVKKLIRSSFELFLNKVNFYSNDIDTCIKVFSIFYPNKKKEIMDLFEYINNPENFYLENLNKDMKDKAISFCNFLVNEYFSLKND